VISIPVIICVIRIIPIIEPQFHIYEIEVGVGNFIRLLYSDFVM